MLNKVTLIGRLGKDPELRSLEAGLALARFTLATEERYQDSQGVWQEQIEWHNIILWRNLAERSAKQLKQGHLIYLEGKLSSRVWQDAQGQEHRTTEIVGSTYRLLKKTMREEIANYEQMGQKNGAYASKEIEGFANKAAAGIHQSATLGSALPHHAQVMPQGPTEQFVGDDDLPF